MKASIVETLIKEKMPRASIKVTGDGRHFKAVIISPDFEGKSLIQRHRMVLDTIKNQINDNLLHAISIKAYTPDNNNWK